MAEYTKLNMQGYVRVLRLHGSAGLMLSCRVVQSEHKPIACLLSPISPKNLLHVAQLLPANSGFPKDKAVNVGCNSLEHAVLSSSSCSKQGPNIERRTSTSDGCSIMFWLFSKISTLVRRKKINQDP